MYPEYSIETIRNRCDHRKTIVRLPNLKMSRRVSFRFVYRSGKSDTLFDERPQTGVRDNSPGAVKCTTGTCDFTRFVFEQTTPVSANTHYIYITQPFPHNRKLFRHEPYGTDTNGPEFDPLSTIRTNVPNKRSSARSVFENFV